MSLAGLRVVFMGTPAFSLPSLEALLEAGCDVVAVVTQPDRPRGRGRRIGFSPVKELALERGLTVYQPARVGEEGFVATLRDISPDVIVVVAFGQILPRAVLDIPPMGCINVHASLLPSYRGAAPINWAIMKGEKVTGVTTMLMDEGMDTGDMLLKREIEIVPGEDAETLSERLAGEGARLLIETLERLRSGSVEGVRQDDSKATYAPLLRKEDGLIDWSRRAEEIVDLVRGALPWPVAHTKLRGKTLKVYRAGLGHGKGRPGTVLEACGDRFEVAAGDGSVMLHELQLEGKKRLKTGDFLRGFSVEKGEVLGN